MKIFIISLPRLGVRRDFMSSQIATFAKYTHLDFNFFDGVDARMGEHLKFNKYFSDFLSKLYRGKTLVDGEKACFASHFSLWQKCIELDEPIIILEDDVILKDGFLEILDKLQKWEYVRLMGFFEKKLHSIDDYFCVTYENICGTQGYYLTPYAATRFCKYAKKWICPVDDYMDKFYIHGVDNILLKNSVLQESSELNSSIASRKAKPSLFYKISREFFRGVEKAYVFLYKIKTRKKYV